MSAKHTPGPWARDAKGNPAFIPLRAHHCERLGFSVGFVSCDDSGEPQANARLISAAPEMLEALIRIRHWAEADHVHYTGDHPVAKVRAAINKATGSEQ